jgi:8-oxo-dGTP pyrophosphatase MutT (NUDIX family)
MAESSVVPIQHLDLRVAPFDWPFARGRRAEIEANFERRQRLAPKLWNGRVLLMRNVAFAGSTLRGDCFETGYADFLAWRDWDFADRSVANCFSLGALKASDGAYLLGVMGAHTAAAGKIYFPGGTPDPSDVGDGQLDLEKSVAREVAEETGLKDAKLSPGWHAVIDRQYVALIKTIERPEAADELREKIWHYLASEDEPELADIRIVRSPRDFDPMMPPFMTIYLTDAFNRR